MRNRMRLIMLAEVLHATSDVGRFRLTEIKTDVRVLAGAFGRA